MKKFLMALAVLVAISGPALAGVNSNGALIVHNTGLAPCVDGGWIPSETPACGDVVNHVDDQSPVVWKVYAAFAPSATPRLKTAVFGEAFTSGVQMIAGGSPNPDTYFEISQGGWPITSGGGVGLTLPAVFTDLMIELYWFAGYNYTGEAGSFSAAPHPVQPTVFVDDSIPPVEDPIAFFGTLGFGQAGTTPCPEDPAEGACCIATACVLMTADACVAAEGTYVGGACDPNPCDVIGACCQPDGICFLAPHSQCVEPNTWDGGVCDPNPCPSPVQETTWGQIKANYR